MFKKIIICMLLLGLQNPCLSMKNFMKWKIDIENYKRESIVTKIFFFNNNVFYPRVRVDIREKMRELKIFTPIELMSILQKKILFT
jgi:hypothetical protein